MSRKLYRIFLSIWVLFTCVAVLMPKKSLLTKPRFIIEIPHIDKAVHFILFSVFAFLLYNVMGLRKTAKAKFYIFAITLSLIFGLLTEVLQDLLTQYIQRTFSWWDFLTDAVGIFIALLAYLYFLKK